MHWTDLISIQKHLDEYHLDIFRRASLSDSTLSRLSTAIVAWGPRKLLAVAVEEDPTSPPGLATFLLSHRVSKASNPRDKVYSLIGLSAAQDDQKLRIDYSKSIREVFVDVIRYDLITNQRLDLICAIPRLSGSFKLPSWAPDVSIFLSFMANVNY
jgi:hypothetical protein